MQPSSTSPPTFRIRKNESTNEPLITLLSTSKKAHRTRFHTETPICQYLIYTTSPSIQIYCKIYTRYSSRLLSRLCCHAVPRVNRAKVTTLAAYGVVACLVYCHRSGHHHTPADSDNSYLGNLLSMMGLRKSKGRKSESPRRKGIWILGADHKLTNSTSALLHSASSLADPLNFLRYHYYRIELWAFTLRRCRERL